MLKLTVCTNNDRQEVYADRILIPHKEGRWRIVVIIVQQKVQFAAKEKVKKKPKKKSTTEVLKSISLQIQVISSYEEKRDDLERILHISDM